MKAYEALVEAEVRTIRSRKKRLIPTLLGIPEVVETPIEFKHADSQIDLVHPTEAELRPSEEELNEANQSADEPKAKSGEGSTAPG